VVGSLRHDITPLAPVAPSPPSWRRPRPGCWSWSLPFRRYSSDENPCW